MGGGSGPIEAPPTLTDKILSLLAPPVGIVGLGLLLIVFPLVILTAESFLLPWIDASQLLNFGQTGGTPMMLPWHFYVKAVVFTVLGGGLTVYLVTQIKLAYLQAWANRLPRPDELHVDYAPIPYYSGQALLQWKWHRFMVIVVPPLALVALSAGLAWLGVFTMNTVMDLSTLALPSAITVFMFIGLMLGFVTFLSCLNGLWLLITTAFGDVAAMLEPDLPPQVIFDRVRRIHLKSPLVWLLYPCVAMFWVLGLAYVIWLAFNYDIHQLVTWQFPWLTVMGYQAGLSVFYLILNYLILTTYHNALSRYYTKLPPAFRERFAAP